jgi:hypothetical protein
LFGHMGFVAMYVMPIIGEMGSGSRDFRGRSQAPIY